jgi:para-nitrobenzyl esterase
MAAVSPAILLPGMGHASKGDAFRVIETTTGKIRGQVRGDVAAFKGIHYGASTAGPNRFRPPQPVRPWRGVRDALRLGDQCPQTNSDYPVWLDSSPASEDCLVLNVWSPAEATRSARLPVMVWIHGGGFTFGSAGAPFYDCGGIAGAGNVVAVGINHRLGIFGYSFFGDDGDSCFASSGNAGQLDIVAALRWVRDNIEAFGGDPSNITLFGESGGGCKISALLGMPSAQGLFHKAIVQSGSLVHVREQNEVLPLTRKMYDILGTRQGDILALQRVPTQQLLECGDRVMSTITGGVSPYLAAYGPVIDGYVIAEQPWSKSAPSFSYEIPMIIGSTLHETAGFIGPDLSNPGQDDEAIAVNAAKFAVLNHVDAQKVQALLPVYRKVMPSLSNSELLVRASTDIGFWKNAVHQSERKWASGGAPVYMYQCDWKTPCLGGMWATHGIELPFVFNNDHYGVAWDGKDSDEVRAAADPQNMRYEVRAQMFNAWINFAKTGNPSTPDLPWPAYETTSRSTMIFDQSSRVVNDPRSEIREQVLAL